MKKWVIFSFSLLLLILVLLLFKVIERENPSGEAISEQVGLNISVIFPPPSLTILNPTNGTYLSKNNLLLNFSSSYANNFWYKVDSENNITINSSTYFNVSGMESHTLYLYANNSNGTTSKNITFSINTTKFTIIDDEYEEEEDSDEEQGNITRHTKKGSSTDFLDYSYEELQNFSNLILHQPNYGKIRFNEAINLTNDEDYGDNVLNLNNNTEISFNNIEINSTAIPNFNKSATLWLYNLTFSNPRILKDGAVCPDSICTQENYSGGTLKFNVTQFSVYSSEETPTGQVTESPGGGGGGGKIINSFTVNKEEFKLKLKQGEFRADEIKIKNTGTETSDFNITISPTLKELIKIGEKTFSLAPNQEKIIEITFIAEENLTPDLYLGEIIIESNGVKKQIFAAIEVESKEALFDVSVEIPSKYKYVLPGEEILFKVELFNLGEKKRVDIIVEYIIKDKEGNEILNEKETIAVETSASKIKILQIPENLKYGNYILYIKTTYNGAVASASEWFIVGKKPISKEDIRIYAVAAFLLILMLFIIFEIAKIKKSYKHHINEITLLKKGMIKQRQ